MRELNLLHPQVREKAERLIALCKDAGVPIIITQTLRTREEQDALYAKGRTAAGKVVTHAQYPLSMHCWGLAFDVARADGKPDSGGAKGFYDGDNFFRRVGELGKSIGLTWGGDWATFPDKPHFEDRGVGGTVGELVKRWAMPAKFLAGGK
jgi:peptidoglycan L-alanyl-D-glutamate endopeptidase CwlK